MAELTIKVSRSDVVKMLIDGYSDRGLQAVAFRLGISGLEDIEDSRKVPELRTQVKFALLFPHIKYRETLSFLEEQD